MEEESYSTICFSIVAVCPARIPMNTFLGGKYPVVAWIWIAYAYSPEGRISVSCG